MQIPEEIKTRYAKEIFYAIHPRSDWQKYPTTKQSQEQEYLKQVAAVLINHIVEDKEIADLVLNGD